LGQNGHRNAVEARLLTPEKQTLAVAIVMLLCRFANEIARFRESFAKVAL
jgi:hypothetical protein